MKPQQMPRPKSRGPRDRSYGDPSFKGLGIIECAVCGKPLAGPPHERIGPCPELGGGDVRLTAPRRATKKDKENR